MVYLMSGLFPKTIINNTTVHVNKIDSIAKKNNKAKAKNSSVGKRQTKSNFEQNTVTLDTTILKQRDSLTAQPIELTDNEDVIDRERLIKIVTLPIAGIEKDDSDTSYQETLAKKMGKEMPFQAQLRLELWQSPLGYSGYKLNKSILVLYGITNEDGISLSYQGNGSLQMEINGNSLTLHKTEEFKPLQFQ